MTSRLRLLPVAALLVGALLAGCTSSGDAEEVAADATEEASEEPRIILPGAPGEPNRELTPEEAAELTVLPEHTEADVQFMQDMVHHHAQALEMTALVEDRTEREDLPLFVERMDISQRDEIELIERWLTERDEEMPSTDSHADHGDGAHGGELMPGMLTEEEMAALEAAEGEEFDVLFLQSMIRHHQGALQMVQELWDAGGGNEQEIFQFAQHVVSDQDIEISRMYRMLADIEGGS